MIHIETLRKRYQDSKKQLNKQILLAVLYELEAKPDIQINREKLDATDKEDEWPVNMTHRDVFVNLLSYKGLPLNLSVWADVGGVSISFPPVPKHYFYLNRTDYIREEALLGLKQKYLGTTWSGQRYTHNAGTTVQSYQNLDDLYEKILVGYKRYQSKLTGADKANAKAKVKFDADVKNVTDFGGKVDIVEFN